MDEKIYFSKRFGLRAKKVRAGYNLINIRYELSVLKKRVLTYSAHLPICAKNANLTEKQAKSDILCDLLTHNISLFSFYTSNTQSKQNFLIPTANFHVMRKKACVAVKSYQKLGEQQINSIMLLFFGK